jgi:tRNA (guanine-N7-)-methyltransferase
MSRQKSKRFSESKLMSNIIELGKDNFLSMAGNWNTEFFKNSNPLVIELACGKGEYSYGLGKAFPDKNFVGMDIKGSRIYVGAKAAEVDGLSNVAFLRGKIENLRSFFGWKEVDEIWITFPDPRPRDKDEKKRLTFTRFLKLYQHIIKDESIIHLKTDNKPLTDYTVETVLAYGGEVLALTYDLYESEWKGEHLGIQTYFEDKFTKKGFKINYLKFRLPHLEKEDEPIPAIFFRKEEMLPS